MQYSLKSPKKDSTAAKNYCFGLLKFRARSEREIRDRLRQHKFDNLIITQVIEYLKNHKLLNDEDFALAWTRSRLVRPLGLKRIYFELKQKGIEKNIIDQVFGDIRATYNETEIVERLAKEKFEKLKRNTEPNKAKQKIYAYLLRRGFSPDIVSDSVSSL